MEEQKKELYEILKAGKNDEEYIPVIETVKDHYMILGEKVARSSRESRRRYLSYLESKGSERFDKLVEAVKLDGEKRKGIWFGLDTFIEKLGEEDVKLIKESIEKYH